MSIRMDLMNKKMEKYGSVIAKVAVAHGLDVNLVKAIVMKESSCNPLAIKFEEGYRWLYFPRGIAEHLGVSYEKMVDLQSHSYGLMQVMGATAYEYGLEHNQSPETLFDPEIGLKFGCRYLRRLKEKYGEEVKAISAYNAGHVDMVNGMFSNQSYVDSVHQFLFELRKLK